MRVLIKTKSHSKHMDGDTHYAFSGPGDVGCELDVGLTGRVLESLIRLISKKGNTQASPALSTSTSPLSLRGDPELK